MSTRRISALLVAVATITGANVMTASADTGDGDIRVITRPPAGPSASSAVDSASAPPRAGTTDGPITGDCDQPVLTDRRGDAQGVDIVSTTITSDCSLWTVTTRFARPVDLDRMAAWVVSLDATSDRGCDGAEHAVATYPNLSTTEAFVVATPSCDQNSWITLGRARVTQPDRRSLQVTFSGWFLQSLSRDRWLVGVSPRNAPSFDVVPDDGRQAFLPPISPPQRLEWRLISDDLKVSWSGGDCPPRGEAAHFALTTSKDGGTPRPVRRFDSTSSIETITELTPESTYVVSITTVCGKRRSRPAVFSIDIPTGADLLPDGVVRPAAPRTPDPAIPTAGKQTRGRCDQPVERDERGDGTVDIASIRITSDCRRVQFTLTTHRPFTDADLGDWAVFLGPGDYCDGMKWIVFVSGGPSLSAELLPLAGECFVNGNERQIEVERLSPTTLRFTLPSGVVDAKRYTWYSYTDQPDGDGTDGATPYTVATLQPLDPPGVGLESSLVSGMAYLTAVTSLSVDYFEVQHRRPGTRWSPIIRSNGYSELALEPGGRHEVRVRIVSRGHRSAWTVKTTTVVVPPDPLRNVQVTATDDLLTVEFLRPASTGGAPLSAITVQYQVGLGTRTCNGRALRCTFSNPRYPGLVTLWSETVDRGTTRLSPVVAVAVPDPTP